MTMKECSIVIPTYNRPAFLHRLLNYYSGHKEELNIIVADSGSDENKRLSQDIVSLVPNIDIKYVDYPTTIHPYHKVGLAIKEVETEYCVLCADDDFITVNGIEQSVAFLKKSQDFAVAHGQYFAFYLADDGEGKRLCWIPPPSYRSILFPCADDRLKDHLSKYLQPTLYGVHRTGLLKMVFEEMLKAEVDLYLFGELLLSMLTIIHGKMKYLDIFYAARSADSVVVGRYWPTLREARKAGIYDEEYTKFKNCLATYISGKVVDEAMSAYMEKYFPHEFASVPISSKKMILNSLHLPSWMNGVIITSYLWIKRSFVALLFSKHRDELNRIRYYVLGFCANKVDTK